MEDHKKGMPTVQRIEVIASICHEANRALCEAYGDVSQVPWADAPDWQKWSAIEGVKFFLTHPNAGPEAQHDQWMEHKIADGWKYGPVEDAEKKEHPCLVPFNELSPVDQYKDKLFQGICRALL